MKEEKIVMICIGISLISLLVGIFVYTMMLEYSPECYATQTKCGWGYDIGNGVYTDTASPIFLELNLTIDKKKEI